ncbi:MAG: hypothetical protein ACYCZV_11920, partial [Acidimicrobiales bacterium]
MDRLGGRILTAALSCLLVMGGVAVAPAWAQTASGSSASGADISYPQCGSTFPSGMGFGITGVTGGRTFSPNGCLGGSGGELAWAAATGRPSLYMNTADPSTLSAEWADPSGNAEGVANYSVVPPPGGYRPCFAVTDPGFGCDWDYGWNSAQYAYQQAVASAAVPAGTLLGMRWWADVETANSWTINDPLVTWSPTGADAADLRGVMAGLAYARYHYALTQPGAKAVAMPATGIYTNASSWTLIMGGTAAFSSQPAWVPGAAGPAQAGTNCTKVSPTRGQTMITQWTSAV